MYDSPFFMLELRIIYVPITYGGGQISDSIKQFGVSDKTTSILVVMLGEPPSDEDKQNIAALIQGEQVGLDALPELTDLGRVSKIYKAGSPSSDRGELLALVVGAMALKGHT
ncbi:hypothetical protein HK104_005824 [Borealophlyctis nickersoniae]|nr:hypothetical protein HK104_005824 [Borealophlyctis nickersoniae]